MLRRKERSGIEVLILSSFLHAIHAVVLEVLPWRRAARGGRRSRHEGVVGLTARERDAVAATCTDRCTAAVRRGRMRASRWADRLGGGRRSAFQASLGSGSHVGRRRRGAPSGEAVRRPCLDGRRWSSAVVCLGRRRKEEGRPAGPASAEGGGIPPPPSPSSTTRTARSNGAVKVARDVRSSVLVSVDLLAARAPKVAATCDPRLVMHGGGSKAATTKAGSKLL